MWRQNHLHLLWFSYHAFHALCETWKRPNTYERKWTCVGRDSDLASVEQYIVETHQWPLESCIVRGVPYFRIFHIVAKGSLSDRGILFPSAICRSGSRNSKLPPSLLLSLIKRLFIERTAVYSAFTTALEIPP